MGAESQEFDAEELLALAGHEFQRGEFQPALLKPKRLVSRSKPLGAALEMIARLYARIGLMDRAQKSFLEYLETNPQSAHATFELGVTYFDQGKSGKALECWKRTLELEPAYPPALFYSALAHAVGGDADDARRQLDVLFKSAQADNLYVGRGRELLKSIEEQATAPIPLAAVGLSRYGGH